jgi:phosphoserine phosphatase RsbU/P
MSGQPVPGDRTTGPDHAGNRISILIVDDDPVIAATLNALTSAAGYAVRVAGNGREAWESHQRAPAAVVISDWHMPEMDGLELCRRIRARPNEPYVYFILITAYGGKQQYALGMEAGADDFITKPLDMEELRARLRVAERILGLRQYLQRLEGLLPICAYCKRIRDEGGSWESIELYIQDRSKAQFSHGICADCYAKVVAPQLAQLEGPA